MCLVDLGDGDWAFIPGPVSDPPTDSLRLHDMVEYSPEAFTSAVLAFPGMVLAADGDGDWWKWRATRRAGERQIDVGMSTFETDPVTWGGSDLKGICELSDILALWEFLRARCPGVWMHNSDCEIHTPESFRRLFSDQA